MSNNNLRSTFRWDGIIIAITVFYNILLVGGIYVTHNCLWVHILLVICWIGAPLYMPLHLTVDNEYLQARLVGPKIRIRVSDIKSCRIVTEQDALLNDSIRTFGSGGVYGYLGHFKSTKHGKYIIYATHVRQLFLVKTKQGKLYVFSSPKREEFVSFIEQSIRKNNNKINE